MTPIFVDTSYLLALELASDQNHQLAQTHWQQIIKALPPLVTTSYIFDEVITYFNSRGYHQKAVQVGQMLLQSPSVEFIHIDSSLFQSGWSYFQRYQDKKYSLTDCLSLCSDATTGYFCRFHL